MKKSIQLVKKEDGSFIPAYPSDEEEANKIKVGEEVTVRRSRNPEFHRKVFSLIKLGFANQDVFDNFDIYRQVLTMKAGYVTWVKGKDNKEHPLPKSLSFDSMSQTEFEDLFRAVLEVISKELKTSGAYIEEQLINYM